MVLIEKKKNLFEVEKWYYLAHCISVDHKMGAGIAVEFNKKFKLENEFKEIEQSGVSIRVGDCFLIGKVFNLITKSKYYGKPTYDTITKSIKEMRDLCISENIEYLAMPKIGCGLDRLQWGRVREILESEFKDVDIQILVCHL